jgi:HEPN domain-containing protein
LYKGCSPVGLPVRDPCLIWPSFEQILPTTGLAARGGARPRLFRAIRVGERCYDFVADMNRSDLQLLADLRAEDAKILLDARRFAGAYYLAGYAVECALKACITKQIREFDFPDKKLITESYSHDLTKLLRLSGIGHLHDAEIKTNAAFENNWLVVKDWSEESRYEVAVAEAVARDMYAAVTDTANGVLTWLKTQW